LLHRTCTALQAATATLTLACALASPAIAQTQTNITPSPQAQQPDANDGEEDLKILTKQLQTLADEAIAINDEGPEGIVPLTKGFNASFGTTSEHDSAGGWFSTISPNIAYRFNRHFSLDLGLPVYTYVNLEEPVNITNSKGVVTGTTDVYQVQHFKLGDTDLVGAFDTRIPFLDYTLTATLGMPTGDDADALGTGQFTYAFVNHFEHTFGQHVTPDIELGIDDNPGLTDSRVHKSYQDVGTNAHFQAGFAFALPFDIAFETNAYEELPLTDQTITSSTTNGKKGKQQKIITTTSQVSIGEDNGFENTLDIPLNGHVTLSGFYNRSLRNHFDIAGFSITFLLRAPPRAKKTLVH
jgi:hypothetical protein